MKNTMKRVLVAMLALMMLGIAVLPTALAAEGQMKANATSRLTTYVGLKTPMAIYDYYGYQLSNSDYKWKSSKSTVVSVTSKGVITAKKTGSATITATNKYNKYDKVKAVVTVKANKINFNTSRPSASAVKYKTWDVFIKSANVVSPSRVDVEYYMVCNYPSNWRAAKLNSMHENLRAYTKSTDTLYATVVNGYGSTVYGFTPRYGRSVQVIRIAYKSGAVYNTNLRLSKYNFRYYPQGNITRYIY